MASDTTLDLRLNDFLPYRLFVLANRISDSLAKHYEKRYEIARPEWRVLAVLGEETDLSAATVSERTTMDKVAVSRAVTKLLGARLIQRCFDPIDRRRSVLALTDKGRELYEEIVPIALEHERKLLDQLDDHEIDLLRKMLEKLDGLNFDF